MEAGIGFTRGNAANRFSPDRFSLQKGAVCLGRGPFAPCLHGKLNLLFFRVEECDKLLFPEQDPSQL